MSEEKKQDFKSKLFLSTKDKDDVARIRSKEDFELEDEAKANFPKYSPDVVLKSFAARDENANRKFFAKTWEKMKQNIIGQTMYISLIYLLFYYLIQILFVQQAVNTSGWMGRNVSRDGIIVLQNRSLSVPLSCETDFCKCYNSLKDRENITTENLNGKPHETLDTCIEAKKFAKFVESWSKKQSGLVE